MTHRTARILLALIVVYAAALRLEAITAGYGPVTSPGWLRWLQERTAGLMPFTHPSAVRWDPVPTYPHRDGTHTHYYSDPYNYLQFGRQMTSFSAAHYREPLFPFATKVALWLLRDQDVAVSFASAAFSVLMVVATYLLGAYVFSRGVGLAAALGVAIEYDIVSWDVAGWRDEAFAFAVLMVAYAAIRLRRSPTRANSLLLGAAAGIAGLLRITSLTFLAPVFAYVLWTNRRRDGVRQIGLAAITCAIFVGPYVFNCWRVFGDPFYAISPATHDYLALAEQNGPKDQPSPREPVFQPPPLASDSVTTKVTSSVPQVGSKLIERPFQTIDTFVLGLTSYPFTNKWTGFDRWRHGIGVWISWLTLVGLLFFAASWEGRLLVMILVTATVPFAVTWRLTSDWRFTEHAYPFYLIAAAYAVALVAPALRPARLRELATTRRPPRRTLLVWAAGLAGVACVTIGIVYLLPVLLVREALRLSSEATIESGGRDAAFFSGPWSGPVPAGNVTLRTSQGPSSAVRVPLPHVEAYYVTVRLDPAPRPKDPSPSGLPMVHVTFNDRPLKDLRLTWDPDRVGSYALTLPADAVKAGANRLTFSADPPDRTFALWYVRVRPSSMKPPPDPVMAIDAPAPGARITTGEPFVVSGWALDRTPPTGSGVNAVQAYAFPFDGNQTGEGRNLGAAELGRARPDVARVFGGQRFDHAGFFLNAPGLPSGRYHVVAYARSDGSAGFNHSQVVDVTIGPPPSRLEMALDSPAAGTYAQPIVVAGWAVDLASSLNTGVDGVRVSATRIGAGAPSYTGAASYGLARPDVGKVFGARFTNSGYAASISGLMAGEYELRVEPHSTVEPAANASRTVGIRVKQP